MNARTAAIALAALGIIAVVVAVIAVGGADRDDSSAGFSPYASTNSDTREGGDESAESPSAADSAAVATRKPAKAGTRVDDDGIMKLPDDELNRPGPVGEAAEARRIKNRRPRQDEEPGKQDDLPTGSLDKDDVQKGIQAVRPLLKVCYEDTLEEFPDAAGKVTLGFRIIGEEGEGRVEMTELDDEGTTLFDQKLHDCMQKTIGDAEFETPSGGGVVNVRYPFTFSSDAEE